MKIYTKIEVFRLFFVGIRIGFLFFFFFTECSKNPALFHTSSYFHYNGYNKCFQHSKIITVIMGNDSITDLSFIRSLLFVFNPPCMQVAWLPYYERFVNSCCKFNYISQRHYVQVKIKRDNYKTKRKRG